MLKKLLLTSIISLGLILPVKADNSWIPQSDGGCYSKVADRLGKVEYGECVPEPLDIPDLTGTPYHNYNRYIDLGLELMAASTYDNPELIAKAKSMFSLAADIALTMPQVKGDITPLVAVREAMRAAKGANDALYLAENGGGGRDAFFAWARVTGASTAD